LRADESLWRLPILSVSSEDKEQDAIRAYEAGANLYLVKPVRPRDLAEMVGLLTGKAIG
jgi:two-component system chemotaxis response regulator CheY